MAPDHFASLLTLGWLRLLGLMAGSSPFLGLLQLKPSMTTSLPSRPPLLLQLKTPLIGLLVVLFVKVSARTWDAIRPRAPELDWAKAVWFKGAVPKHAFNMWISQLDRLPTRQRLASWGHIQSFDCCLCTIETESRDHLLFSCEFAAQVWRLAFSRLCPRQRLFCSWAELLSWMRSSSTSAPSLLRKVSAHAIIYNIWRQRNNVLHNNLRIAPLIIFKIVDREIRNIISSRYHRKRWRNLMVLWIR